MKTNYLSRIKKCFVIAMAGTLGLLASCKKDQSSGLNENRVALAGNWKFTDMMQVNNQDGKPQAANDLSTMNYSSIQLGSQGMFIAPDAKTGNEMTGNWDVNGDQLNLKNANGTSLLLNVVETKDGNLTLAQAYPAAGSLASGTIYYTLSKN
jgi:hypothetical protein